MKKRMMLAAFFLCAAGILSGAVKVQAEDLSGRQVRGEGSYQVVLRTRGDLTQDGRISLRDALRALRISAQLDEVDEAGYAAADVDYNGTVNAEDALALLKLALQGGVTNMGYDKPENENLLIVDPSSPSIDNYCFRTMSEAVDYLNANPPATESERKIVLFAPGVIREHTELDAPYVTYRAMETNQESKITHYYASGHIYNSIGNPGTQQASTVFISKNAHDFHAEYMTFENSYNIYVTEEEIADEFVSDAERQNVEEHRADPTTHQTQARAVFVRADRSVFKNCKFYGRQDTLYVNDNRMYFENCYIEGTVDFIYGSATAVFESCQLNNPYGGGYQTAASTTKDTEFGFLFNNCTLTRNAAASSGKPAPSNSSYALGRPWGDAADGDTAMVVYWNCKMDSHIKTGRDRWADMSIKREDARFAEGGSMDLAGNALNLSSVAPGYAKTVYEEDMTEDGVYATWRWLCGKDSWNPGNYPLESSWGPLH